MPNESTASRIAEIEKRLNWKLYCGYSAESQDDIRFLLKLAKPEPDGWVAVRLPVLLEAAREIDQISLMICSPQAWLNEPERKRIAKAILQLRAALALFAPTPPVLPEGEKA